MTRVELDPATPLRRAVAGASGASSLHAPRRRDERRARYRSCMGKASFAADRPVASVAMLPAPAVAGRLQRNRLMWTSPPPSPTPSGRALASCRERLRAAVSILAQATIILRETVDAQDRALAELRAAERDQDVFVVAAVHELKTPLTAIKGQGQLLRRHADRGRLDEARLRVGLAEIDAAADRLAAALDALAVEIERPLPEPGEPRGVRR